MSGPGKPSLWSRLFGGAAAPPAEPVEYNGFRIIPKPIQEGTRWRLAARIEKDAGGTARSHHLIRADVLDDEDKAREAALAKARQVIDEQGDRIFE